MNESGNLASYIKLLDKREVQRKSDNNFVECFSTLKISRRVYKKPGIYVMFREVRDTRKKRKVFYSRRVGYRKEVGIQVVVKKGPPLEYLKSFDPVAVNTF